MVGPQTAVGPPLRARPSPGSWCWRAFAAKPAIRHSVGPRLGSGGRRETKELATAQISKWRRTGRVRAFGYHRHLRIGPGWAAYFSSSFDGVYTLPIMAIRFLLPAVAGLVVIAALVRGNQPALASGIVWGALAGALATMPLEAVRLTGFHFDFMPGNLPRLMGVLLLNRFAQGPSTASDLAGWAYHFWNVCQFRDHLYDSVRQSSPLGWRSIWNCHRNRLHAQSCGHISWSRLLRSPIFSRFSRDGVAGAPGFWRSIGFPGCAFFKVAAQRSVVAIVVGLL